MKTTYKRIAWAVSALLLLSILFTACGSNINVTFDLNYTGAPAAEVVSVDKGAAVTEPEKVPARANFEFLGWFTEAAAENKYGFTQTVESDLTLFAGWEAYPTITFNLNYPGAPAGAVIPVKKGTPADEPNDPERDGFSFSGWYTDASCTFPYTFGAVNGSTTVYAKWMDESVTYVLITFDFNYTGAPESLTQDVPEGTKAQKPGDPTRTDGDKEYSFVAWYTDAAGTSEYDFDTIVDAPLTLYAKWAASYDFWTVYTDLTNFVGNSWQYMDSYPDYTTIERTGVGNSSKKIWDTQGHIADYFLQGVHNTYKQEIVWRIMSDSETTATLQMSMALEIVKKNIDMYSSTEIDVYGGSHRIVVNNEDVPFGKYTDYDSITLSRASETVPMQFDLYTMAEIQLVEGENIIKFVIGENDWLDGVAGSQAFYGSAPTIELIRLNTTADLSWNPKLENIPNRAALEDGF